MIQNIYTYLSNGAAKYENAVHKNALFILQKQLKDRELWKKFVNVFQEKADIVDNGWRGEYFGKMMRGACLTYRYIPDEELYSILYDTVKNLLATQDEDGRITTYTKEAEFNGWDMWTRKYVLVGCLYFYDICKDQAFKEKILNALQAHVDYLIAKIGADKLSILDTSMWYGGLNSSSILEPIVELYKLTGKQKYLDFAEYILNMGGCKGGNLLELAEQEKLKAEYEKETAIVNAQKELEVAKLSAQAKIESAKADAQAQIEAAKAEARAIQLKSIEVARALGFTINERAIVGEDGVTAVEYTISFEGKTAEEIQLITEYMKYLEYLAKWDGKLPTVVAGESATVMIPTPSNGEGTTSQQP